MLHKFGKDKQLLGFLENQKACGIKVWGLLMDELIWCYFFRRAEDNSHRALLPVFLVALEYLCACAVTNKHQNLKKIQN